MLVYNVFLDPKSVSPSVDIIKLLHNKNINSN